MDTPVVFLIFNRPDLTERTFAAIRAAQPRQLLVVADGPRADRLGEAELCEQARAIAEQVDWPCEVARDYSETNMGCGRRVSSGITWAFEHVEKAIILEDDCIASPSFFAFCADLLDRYCDDRRVMHIGGTRYPPTQRRAKASYTFSKYSHVWGWATWRRAWQHYDYSMSGWDDYRRSRAFVERCGSDMEARYWRYYWDRMTGDDPFDTWDYQWMFACWLNRGLAVVPTVNMVSNIGWREDATHTRGDDRFADMEAHDLDGLRHPKEVRCDSWADHWTFVHHYGGAWYRQEMCLSNRLRRRWSSAKCVVKRAIGS